MARGALTALQAALAGLSGGASGYAQYQREQAEERRRTQEAERQALRDALSKEEFSLKEKEFQARFGPEAVARAEREAAKNREAELERTRISSASAANIERMRQAAEERDNEAAGLAYLSEIRSNPEAARTLGAIFSSRPDLARRPGLAAYQLMSRAADREASQLRRAAAGIDDGGASAAPASSLAARQGAGQPMAGGSYGSTTGAPKTKEDRAREWMDANPIRSGESQSEYAARMRAAVGA
jgi:hypothetical protein